MLFGALTSVDAQCLIDENVDTTYIKLDANMLPVNYINVGVEDLRAELGELDPIVETEEFQLYAAGNYTFKVENGVVVSQSTQILDENDQKLVYNKILNALARSKSLRDTHNTGANFYEYADFQIQFDDYDGYQKLTFQAIPADE